MKVTKRHTSHAGPTAMSAAEITVSEAILLQVPDVLHRQVQGSACCNNASRKNLVSGL